MRVLGAVLAGGRSRRFGSDKAAAVLDGKPLLEHVVEALARQCDGILICGRTSTRWDAVPDRPAADLGPLGGLNAALRFAAIQGYDAVLSAPCDVPYIPSNLRETLSRQGSPAHLADLPVIGLWPIRLSGTLDSHVIQTSDRSMRLWAILSGSRATALNSVLRNINRPDDLTDLVFDEPRSGRGPRGNGRDPPHCI